MHPSEKYDICLDARMIAHSGIGTYIKTLVHAIHEDFHLALIGPKQALEDLGLGIAIIPCEYPIYSWREQLLMKSLIPACKVYWSPHFNLPRFFKDQRVITTIHDTYHITHAKSIPFWKRGYIKAQYARAVRKSARIFTVSEFSRQEILRHFPAFENKIRVVHNAILPKTTTSENTGISYPNAVLYIGNQRKNKNLDVLVAAYCRMTASFQEKHPLVLAGKINEEFRSRVERRNNPHIHFLGFITDEELDAYLNSAKVLVQPSTYEGFGLPILEAQSRSLPVIASDIEVFHELYGDHLNYFGPEDAASLFNQLTQILQQETKKGAGVTKIENKYSSFRSSYILELKDLLH